MSAKVNVKSSVLSKVLSLDSLSKINFLIIREIAETGILAGARKSGPNHALSRLKMQSGEQKFTEALRLFSPTFSSF